MAELAPLYPWHADNWQHIRQRQQDGRLPHALLFNGPQGVGKFQFAQHLAQLLLCRQPGEYACGHCRSCELYKSDTHPDLYTLQPDEAGKPIKVDQVRELGEFLHSTAQQGGYRVVILEPAESMNISAANALLKTLEEPGAQSVLLLVTHRLGQVMPTIKSRCQRIDFASPHAGIAARWLEQQLDESADYCAGLLKVAHGSPLRALDYKTSGVLEVRAKLLKTLGDLLRQRTHPLAAAQTLMKADQEQVLAWIYSWLADIMRLKGTRDENSLCQLDARNMLKALAQRTSATQVAHLMDQVHEARTSLIKRQNPNKQLLLENILLGWAALAR